MSQQNGITASTLLRLRSVGERLLLQIDLHVRRHDVADLEAKALGGSAHRELGDRELQGLAKRIFHARRTREEVLNRALFGEPAWEMLLKLYCVPCSGPQMNIMALNQSVGVSQAAGWRWQITLMKDRLIKVDATREAVQLTSKGRAMMTEYLTRIL